MTTDDADRILNDINTTLNNKCNIQPGVYRLFLIGGGSIVASVGRLYDGTIWYAPSNWTAKTTDGIVSTDWSKIQQVALIEIQISHNKV